MAGIIKRGFLLKRLYCGACNKRVSKDDAVCQNCGAPLEFPQAKKPSAPPKPIAPAPEPLPGEGLEEFEEEPAGPGEEPAQEEEFAEEEGFEEPSKKKGIFLLPHFKTVLWVIVAALLLWGLFASDTMMLVAAVLVLILVELDAIRKKLR